MQDHWTAKKAKFGDRKNSSKRERMQKQKDKGCAQKMPKELRERAVKEKKQRDP